MLLADQLRRRTHAAGDDDLAVFLQRRAYGAKRLVARRIQESAGVHDNEIGAVVLARDLVTLGAKPRQDTLGIDERLWATEADETDAWRGH
jgi:hypothetical protein